MSNTADKRPPVAPTLEVRVPDLGAFTDVEIIELLVRVGDQVEKDTPLMTLESDKATIDIPSPAAGKVARIVVKPGDKVNSGTMFMELEGAQQAVAEDIAADQSRDGRADAAGAGCRRPQDPPVAPPPRAAGKSCREPSIKKPTGHPRPAQHASRLREPAHKHDFDLVVLGAGPGGYTAAFRAADLGLKVALVERWPMLGGVCLNVGCIPSKALLHAAKVIEEAHAMAEFGVSFGAPRIDAPKLRAWKNKVVTRLTGGLTALARQRKVTVLRGVGEICERPQRGCRD